jgi:hypothetical protein
VILRSTNIRSALRSRQRGFVLDPYRFAAGGGGATDPLWSFVQLLIQPAGPDASTSFVDQSAAGRTITVNGDAQMDTAQAIYSPASCLLDGSGDYLSVTLSSHNIRTDSCCFETWVRFASGTNGTGFFGSGPNHFYMVIASGNLYIGDGSTNPIGTAHGFSAGTWYHAAYSFDGTTHRYFENGGLVQSSTTLMANRSITAWELGSLVSDGYYLNGWFAPLRITLGHPRYTSAFTPPSGLFPTA